MKDHSNGYYSKVVELITRIEEEQYEKLRAQLKIQPLVQMNDHKLLLDL